jgi:SAM-dependent methyltransferase
MDVPANQTLRLYSDLAWLWPVISPAEDYIPEVEQFVRRIQQHSGRPVHTLLDLGCGGGHNDRWFKLHYQVAGVDLSPGMLDLARQLNPECTYLAGDMRTLRIGQTFDAVVIADSISYMLSEADLRQAFMTAFEHLNPGGVFLTYAEENREQFVQNATSTTTHAHGNLEVTLIENLYDPNPSDTTIEVTYVYLIRQAGELRVELDRHTLGLFSLRTWEILLRETGFNLHREEFDNQEIPLFVCTKPA